MNGHQVQLTRKSDGSNVSATVYVGLKPSDLLLVEQDWRPERIRLMKALAERGIPRADWPESLHWDWSRKAAELNLLAATGIGVLCESKWEAVMLTLTAPYQCRNHSDHGKPLVYIDYLESAPWNWYVDHLSQQGHLRGLGSLMFWYAVQLSVSEGFRGRVGLHSLPQAEKFYRANFGMLDLGCDQEKQNLRYFELSTSAAEKLLKEGGIK